MTKKDSGIYEIEKGKKYRIRVGAGVDPTGKYKQVNRIIHGTKTDAKNARAQLVTDINSGDFFKPKEKAPEVVYLSSLIDTYVSSKRGKGAASESVRKYSSEFKKLLRIMGNVDIASIKAIDVLNYYNEMEAQQYAQTTRGEAARIFRSLMRFAVALGLIQNSPAEGVEAPKRGKTTRHSLTATQLNGLMECASKDTAQGINPVAVAILIGGATGMRKGEVLGLTWADISFTKGGGAVININKQLSSSSIKKPKASSIKDAEANVIKDPKANSSRKVTIDGWTAGKLKEYKAFMTKTLHAAGMSCDGSTQVCLLPSGQTCNPVPFGRRLQIWSAEHGYGYFERDGKRLKKYEAGCHYHGLIFHELRHTQATLQLAAGVDIKTVQARGGWSNAKMLLDVYGHSIPEMDQVAADAFSAMMEKERDKKRAPHIIAV